MLLKEVWIVNFPELEKLDELSPISLIQWSKQGVAMFSSREEAHEAARGLLENLRRIFASLEKSKPAEE